MYKPEVSKNPNLWTFVFIGVAIGLSLTALWFIKFEPVFSFLNPLCNGAVGFFSTLISPLLNILSSAWNTFLTNPLSFIITGGGIITAVYAVFSKIKSEQAKKQAEMDALQQTAQLQNVFTQELDKKDTQIQTLTNQLQGLQGSGQNLAELQRVNETLKQENHDLRLRLADADNFLKVVRSPSSNEMIRSLEEQGYTIKKKVP